jgi:hypothetical protein
MQIGTEAAKFLSWNICLNFWYCVFAVLIFFYTNKTFRSICNEKNFDDDLKFSNEILYVQMFFPTIAKNAQKGGKAIFMIF